MNKLSKDEFADLVIQNKIPMYRLAMGILKNNADAEDAVSETILIAYEHLHSLKDKTKFKSWMMTMLVNESKRVLKRRKKAVLSDNADFFTGVTKESNHEILDLVLSLKEEYQALEDGRVNRGRISYIYKLQSGECYVVKYNFHVSNITDCLVISYADYKQVLDNTVAQMAERVKIVIPMNN